MILWHSSGQSCINPSISSSLQDGSAAGHNRIPRPVCNYEGRDILDASMRQFTAAAAGPRVRRKLGSGKLVLQGKDPMKRRVTRRYAAIFGAAWMATSATPAAAQNFYA